MNCSTKVLSCYWTFYGTRRVSTDFMFFKRFQINQVLLRYRKERTLLNTEIQVSNWLKWKYKVPRLSFVLWNILRSASEIVIAGQIILRHPTITWVAVLLDIIEIRTISRSRAATIRTLSGVWAPYLYSGSIYLQITSNRWWIGSVEAVHSIRISLYSSSFVCLNY